MKLYEILENIDIQCDYKICFYDYETEEKTIVKDEDSVYEQRVLYMYIENKEIFIEVEKP